VETGKKLIFFVINIAVNNKLLFHRILVLNVNLIFFLIVSTYTIQLKNWFNQF